MKNLLLASTAFALLTLNAPSSRANSLDDLNDTLQEMQMDRNVEQLDRQNHRDNAFICRRQKRMSYADCMWVMDN